MVVVGLDHIQLAMPPHAEAVARLFYGQTLGLVELAKPDALQGRGGCWFRAPGLDIHLGVEADFVPARKAHPAFLVANLAAVHDLLLAAGHKVTVDTTVAGVQRLYTADPFGNRLEFIQDGDGFRQRAAADEQ